MTVVVTLNCCKLAEMCPNINQNHKHLHFGRLLLLFRLLHWNEKLWIKFRKATNFITLVFKEHKKHAHNKHFVLFYKAPYVCPAKVAAIYCKKQVVKIRRWEFFVSGLQPIKCKQRACLPNLLKTWRHCGKHHASTVSPMFKHKSFRHLRIRLWC